MRRILKFGCGGVIAIFVLLLVIGALAGKKPDSTAQPKPTGAPVAELAVPTIAAANAIPSTATAAPAKPTATPVPPKPTATPPPPTPVLSPDDLLTKLAREQFKDKLMAAKLSEITLSGVSGGVYANVDYDIGAQWDEGTAVRSIALALSQFGPKVFTIQTVGTLELRGFTEFKDVYGKTTQEVAMKFTLPRSTAEKINRKDFDQKNLARILVGDGGGVYVHPALRKAWTEYTTR